MNKTLAKLLHPLRTPAPPPSRTPAQDPTKTRITMPAGSFGLPADVWLSEMVHDGHRFLLTNSQAQGSNKKFRYAIDMRSGEVFADLEFRTAAAPVGINKYRELQTYPNRTVAVDEEFQAAQWLDRVRAYEKIAIARPKHGPDAQKIHVLMTLMTESAQSALDRTDDPTLKQCLLRRAVYELSSDLCTLHANGHMHGDVKFDNALTSCQVGIALSDIVPGAQASFPAPEVFKSMPYGKKADVWMLGIACGEAFNSRGPFWYRSFGLQKSIAFATWRAGLFDGQGNFDVARLMHSPGEFGDYFRNFYRGDADLCVYALTDMLDPEPYSRAGADDVRQKAAVLAGPGTAAELQARTVLELLHNTSRRAPIVAGLQRAFAASKS